MCINLEKHGSIGGENREVSPCKRSHLGISIQIRLSNISTLPWVI